MNLKTLSLKFIFVLTAFVSISLPSNAVSQSRWIEADSTTAIQSRTLADFSLTFDEAVAEIERIYGKDVASQAREFADKNYIETMVFDGVERVHHKSIRNLALLNPAMNGGWNNRGFDASEESKQQAIEVYSRTSGDGKTAKTGNAAGMKRKLIYRFSIDVPYSDDLKNDTLRVWMPLPIESPRQGDIRIVSTSQKDYIVSTLDRSVHNTIYMQKPVVEGETAHFEYEAEFVTYGQYYSPEYILANMKPYDKSSELYQMYTAMEAPHIIRLDSLASSIVGSETNAFKQSEMVYDWIVSRYPWAGAREYSTIPCLPKYVLEEGHGDCGQVTLLYISMMRSLGVPTRWESGWVTGVGDENLHDWSEIYFEGVGWVPVDVSHGRMTSIEDVKLRNFYSTGFDVYRMATNLGVCGKLFPEKRYVRSETIDFQMGEVECSKGNLYYPAWKKKMVVLADIVYGIPEE